MLINLCRGNGQGEDHAHVEAPVAAVLLKVLALEVFVNHP